MSILRKFLDNVGNYLDKSTKLKKLKPVYDTIDTFFYTSGETTRGPVAVRDAINLKRVMTTVMIALLPCVLMALYNTGLQTNLALQSLGKTAGGWRGAVIGWLGSGYDPSSLLANVIHGALYFLPLYIITFAVGISWELLFGVVRGHEVNEGFFVTSLLFPLILPPTTPWWQAALGISFGVVIGKEVFGGVGMNILNPALVARAFLFFAYPAQISGDAVWVAVDGFTKATPLAEIADPALKCTVSWWDAFIGLIPGSMGETSTLACLIGAFILIVTGIGSWRIMVSVVASMVCLSFFMGLVGSGINPMFDVSPYWHLVLGGFAFGTVFMATDPVSAAMTDKGKIFYGVLIGVMVVLVRVVNPAYPEGMMLAILFGNVFAPIIDRIFINANIKRRAIRNVQFQ